MIKTKIKIKVLLIKDKEHSVDIFIEDGGYAYCWKGERDNFIIEYYQGRIDKFIDEDNRFEDICLNNSYNNFRKEYRRGVKFETVLKYALNWFIMGGFPSDFEIINVKHSRKTDDIVNKFLNLKQENVEV